MRGKTPELKLKRLKMFMFGPAGVGKTTAAIQFPNAYIIDTERGTEEYAQTIIKSGSVVFQSANPEEIKQELIELLTTKHEYKTLVIDPMTQVYNAIQDKWTRIFIKNAKDAKEAETGDFGMRFWGKVKSEMKAIQRILLALDMNVIITSHQKDVYGTGFSKIGVTFDSMKGDDYLFDLIFNVEKRGNDRIAKKVKERAEIDFNKFPDEFEWSYENFCKFYGREIIEKAAIPVSMASPEQVALLNQLIEVVSLEQGIIEKWYDKAQAEKFEDFTSEQIQKCIDFVQEKLSKLAPAPTTPEKVAPSKKRGEAVAA